MTDLYPSIWWKRGEARVVDYSASVRETKSVLTIKLAVEDPKVLGYLLEQLAEAKQSASLDRKSRRKPLLLVDRSREGRADG